MILLQHYLKTGGHSHVITLLLLPFLCTCVRAQDIRLNVIVPNPPPVTWEAYLEFDAEIRVIVTNVGAVPHDLKLIPTLTSDRGLSAAFQPDYQPLSPLTVGPGETLNLTFRELRALFGTPNENDIDLQGTSFDRLFASETIPEGNYTLCVEARDYTSSELLSNNFGCAVFFVQQHEPPLIIWPFDGEVVPALTPPFHNFLWSVTGVPGRTRYRFALYDLDELGLFNSADAFILEATRPYFEADDLVASNLAYDLALPPLTPGRRYAVQVSAYDPEGELLFAQGGRSAVHQFTYESLQVTVGTEGDNNNGGGLSEDGPGQFQNEQPGNQLAMQACPPLPPPVPVPYPNLLSAGQTVTVGNHVLVLNSGGAMPLAGTGRVEIASLGVAVNVSFTGLQVNQDLQVYEGAVAAVTEGNPNLDNLSEAAALQLADLVDANDAWINGGDGTVLNLPAGLAGAGMDLILTGMTFTAEGAVLDLFGKVELPEAQGIRRLLLVGQGACLNDESLGQNMDLLLANDQTFDLEDGVVMTFAGGEQGTRLRWNADGIEQLDVDLSLSFAPSVMPGGQAFSARVTAQVEDYQDWIGTVTLGDDVAEALPSEELTMNYEKVEWTYDHSSTQNPDGMTLPTAHPDHPSNSGQNLPNLWQGLYLSEFDVIFPEGFDVSIAAENLLLDEFGVWTRVSAQGNLLDIDDGEIGGWALGINGLELDVRGSSFEVASFDGRLRLPVSDNEVAFNAPLGTGEDFSVALDIGQELELDLFFAQAELAGNSSVGFEKQGDSYRPTAKLNGGMSVGWLAGQNTTDNTVKSFSLPGVNFQDFEISGGPGAPQMGGTFSLDVEGMDQGALANFPLVFTDEPELTVEGSEAKLLLPLGLKLTEIDNGFEAGTTFTVIGDWNDGQNRYNYDRTELNELAINAEMGVLTVEGNVTLYNDDDDFGDGFDGQIDATLNHFGVGLEMQLMVGKMPTYRYFMIDALARFPGVPLGPTGLGLFGLGGGFYYNMDREFDPEALLTINDIPLPEPAQGDENGISLLPDTRGQSATPGVSYFPAKDTLGFNAKAVLGVMPTTTSFNADLEFGMELTTSFSFTEMWMSGKGYVMQDMADRDGGSLISGEVMLNIQPQEPRFQLVSKLEADIYKLMQGKVTLDILASPSEWHVYLGKWNKPDNPANYLYSDDPGRNEFTAGYDFGFANISTGSFSYFMMGNDLHPGLPPKPAEIVNIFEEKPGNLPSVGLGETLTTGFAFGMVNDFELGFKALIFRLDARYFLGFDVLLADLSQQQCNEDDFGINNWYADGRAYAYLAIDGSVEGRLFRKMRKFKFAEIEAAADMQFKGPKPTWLKGQAAIQGEALGGLIKFDTKVGFEFGKEVECRDGSGNIFDDIPIVEDFDPVDGATGQSVFADPTVTFNFPRGVFPIEQENDEGGTDTEYYSYEILSFKVEYKVPGGEWKDYTDDIIGPNYDQAGRSCRYDLREQIVDEANVKMTIIVVGHRHGSDNINDIDETFDEQPYTSFFRVGKAPDYILTNSIDQARPFPMQRHFFKNDAGGGHWNFWTDRISNDIFRTTPKKEDELDPAGQFRYRVRFTNVGTGEYRDMIPTSMDHEPGGGVDFPIPKSWMKKETVYSMDLMRIYVPPAGSDIADNTKIEMTNLTEGQADPLAGGGGTLVFFPGTQSDDDQGGGGQGGGGQTLNNLTLANNNGGGMQMMVGMSFPGGQSFGIDDPGDGPDPPAPFVPGQTLAGQNDGGDDGVGGSALVVNEWLAPGGTLNDIKYEARKVKVRGRVTNNIESSIMQQPLYFRTSKYATKAAKVASIGVKTIPGMDYPTLDYYVAPEASGGNPEGHYPEAPVFFLSCGEKMDRFETTNWTYLYTVGEKGNFSDFHVVNYYPDFSFGGDRENWLFENFPGSDNANGVRRAPFGQADEWCEVDFDDPDSANIYPPDENVDLDHIKNPPLHNVAANGTPARYTFEPYVLAANDEHSELDTDRYNNPIFTSRRNNRQYPTTQFPEGGNHQAPTVDFFRFSNPGHEPTWAANAPFKVQNTHTSLTWLEINNLKDQADAEGFLAGTSQWQTVPQGDGFIPVVDFSEFIAVSDYKNYRRLIYEGTTYLAEFSETADNPQLGHLFNHNTDPNCDDPPGPIPGHPGFSDQTANYNYWYQYDKPIRAWLKDDFEYKGRDNQALLNFSVEGRDLSVVLPKLND